MQNTTNLVFFLFGRRTGILSPHFILFFPSCAVLQQVPYKGRARVCCIFRGFFSSSPQLPAVGTYVKTSTSRTDFFFLRPLPRAIAPLKSTARAQ